MLPIALDAMGGDHAPEETVKGATLAADEGLEVILVGSREALRPYLGNRLPLVEASEAIGMAEPPTRAVLNKSHSSIAVGMGLVKDGKASAFVSAGSTGAIVAAACLILGKLEGVERPALALPYSTLAGPALLLDVGANADCRPSFLLQFARLGSLYMERVMGIPRPRVGLLSIGEEEGKGSWLVRESYPLLKGSGLNFIGNVEGKDLFQGVAEVVVTDGFTGNVVLKASEGFGEALFRQLALSLRNGLKYRLLGPLLRPVVRSLRQRVDYSEHGGAPLLGVKGNVVIAHGRSRALAIRNALRLARRLEEQGVAQALRG